jgi:hypothetical protein
LGLRVLGAVLVLGLLFLNGAIQLRSASGSVGDASDAHAALPHADQTGSNSTTATRQPLDLNGTWQGNNGNTYTITEGETDPGFCEGGGSNPCLSLRAVYLTDPSCPSEVGQTYISAQWNDSNNTIGPGDNPEMYLCTSSTNPIVQNCSQPADWTTTFNASLTQDSIIGLSQGQYWTWNTTSSGDIIPSTCHIEYYTSDAFSLDRIAGNSSTTTSTSSTSSSSYVSPPTTSGQQSSGGQTQNSGNGGSPGQGSSSSAAATSSSSSSRSGSSGSGGILIIVLVAVVAIVGGGISWVILRMRPPKKV